MEKEHDIRKMEEALDIFKQAHDLTPAQLSALQEDDELRDDVALVHTVKEALHSDAPMDVEARLRQFHARMDKGQSVKPPNHRRRNLFIASIGIAAAVIAAVFFLHIEGNEGTDRASDAVLTAEHLREGITVTTDAGGKMTVAGKGTQAESISMSDFQKVLAEAGVSEKVTLDVPSGASADITLPDGTIVYMHPGARIIFPNRFTDDRREVVFEGEAYFKVAHDSAHPFVITSGKMQTTVLGTEFNISTTRSSVVLVNGSVSLRQTESGAHVLLRPNQEAVLSGDKAEFTVSETDVTPYEFWRDGYLYFEQAELKDIMDAIGRNFNMTVVFRNDEALHYRMRFIAQRNNGVETVIKAMNEMGKAMVYIKGNTIYVE